MYDLLGLGVIAIDTLLYVDSYPPEDTKARVLSRQHRLGGLTGAGLTAAARAGARCAYAGILGTDALSQEVIERMQAERIDMRPAIRREGAGPVESFVVVARDRSTRTLFYDTSRPTGADETLPEAEMIRSARVLYADHHGVEGMIRAARIAREAGIPVTADLERIYSPRFPELLALADHLILSTHFAESLTGQSQPGEIIAALWSDERQVVGVTRGREGAWFRQRGSQEVQYQPAFPVETLDSTGCGDVFHGVYAAGLAEGRDAPERVRRASAAAALKAAHGSIPNRAEIDEFLRQRSAG